MYVIPTYVCVYVCLCVCMCVYVNKCVCVCVCLCGQFHPRPYKIDSVFVRTPIVFDYVRCFPLNERRTIS